MASDTHPTEETYKDILSKVQSNDASITAINLNNLSGSKNEWVKETFLKMCEKKFSRSIAFELKIMIIILMTIQI